MLTYFASIPGSLIQRNAFAEVGAAVAPRLPGGDLRTANTEGLALRVRGDGNVYTCVLSTGTGCPLVRV